jgi:hypothetical protein
MAAIGLAACTAAFAQYPTDRTGIGIVGGGGGGYLGGSGSGYGDVGLSLKFSHLPIFWGVFAQPSVGFTGLRLTGDFYLLNGNMVSNTLEDGDGYTYDLNIDWFIGLGAFANFLFWSETSPGFAFGGRLPIGLSWRIDRLGRFELALAVVPGLGVYFGPVGSGNPYFTVGGELAIRHWLSPRKG